MMIDQSIYLWWYHPSGGIWSEKTKIANQYWSHYPSKCLGITACRCLKDDVILSWSNSNSLSLIMVALKFWKWRITYFSMKHRDYKRKICPELLFVMSVCVFVVYCLGVHGVYDKCKIWTAASLQTFRFCESAALHWELLRTNQIVHYTSWNT